MKKDSCICYSLQIFFFKTSKITLWKAHHIFPIIFLSLTPSCISLEYHAGQSSGLEDRKLCVRVLEPTLYLVSIRSPASFRLFILYFNRFYYYLGMVRLTDQRQLPFKRSSLYPQIPRKGVCIMPHEQLLG